VKRGEVWIGNLHATRGGEAGKSRPLLILQADFLTENAEPTIIVLPLTTQVRPSKEPLHITIRARDQLQATSQVMPEQVRAIDRNRLVIGPLTRLTTTEMAAVERSFLAVTGF
jgi:mRNA interferase MazF